MAEVTITDESAARLRELWEGLRREHGDDRDEADLVDDAIARVHRGFFGLPPGSGPQETTGPFRKWASDRPAEVLLRQVDPKTFRLAQPFRYDDGTHAFSVPEDDVTDLASVPRFLTWLVPRYGRHTLAALAHDYLQGDEVISGTEADRIFRDSMGEIGVPLARRWLMWSAVALRTQCLEGGLRLVRAVLWVALFGLAAVGLWGTVAVVLASGASGDGALLAGGVLAGAFAAPIALSWVWGRNWRLGAVGGLALVTFTVPVVLVLGALGVYLGVEWLAEHLLVPRARRRPVLTRDL